ncbi:MAG: tetratricopeptide repeat protein [Pseudomonadota bacterium]
MMKKLLLILPICFLISACQESSSDGLNDESINLQKQANEEVAYGIAEDNGERLEKAKELIEQSLQADPDNHAALLNRAQVAVYQQNYERALRDVESAYAIAPGNDSLPLFRCMLIEEVEGDDSGKECYSSVDERYAERHSTDNEIPVNWVGAAILADTQGATELVETYLDQARSKGEMEAEMAETTIESLRDGSYVDQVLMRRN